ncbi:MAG: hypothetical protein M3340_05595 [Actinomycetota bacterium]|nr:hypothetical protein [Actinomycetota bacterium]
MPAHAAQVEGARGGPVPDATRAAADRLARALPPAVEPSSGARVDGQVVSPTLTQVGDHLSAIGALGNQTISLDPTEGFALDTSAGAVTLAPVWAEPGSSAALVNGDSALFTDVQSGLDALLRPTAAGVATVLQVDDALASTTFAWSVTAPRGESLRALDDGGVAVVATDSGGETVDAPVSTSGIDEPETLADPGDQYAEARTEVASADAETDERLLAVIHAPEAQDAAGRPVPTRLEVDGDVVKVVVDHRALGVQYPVTAATSASAPEAWRKPWRESLATGTVQDGPDGLQKVLLPDGEVLLTHGPDPRVPDRPRSDAALFDPEVGEDGLGAEDPVEPLEGHTDGAEPDPEASWLHPEPTGLPPVPGGDPVCADRGRKRVQVMMSSSRPLDDPDRKYLTRRIRRIVKGMNVKLMGEALDSGNEDTPRRLVVACEPSGRLAVRHFETIDSTFEEVVSKAKAAGATDGNTKYLIFEEGANPQPFCGEANMYDDERPTTRNLNNGRRGLAASGAGNDATDGDDLYEGGYAIVYGHVDGEEGCWDVDTALHENGHTMGAVQNNAPDSNTLTHCDDGFDVMCQDDRSDEDIANGVPLTYREDVCPPGPRGWRYDCDYDTYFDAGPESGEYLDENWNIGTRENLFLNFSKPAKPDETFVFTGNNGDEDGDPFGGIWRGLDDGMDRPVEIDHGSNDRSALSPDAQEVVYTGPSDTHPCFEVRIMESDGGGQRPLWDCGAKGLRPANNARFSPSGRSVVFDDGSDIWITDLNGASQSKLIAWANSESQPAFTVDGEQLLLSSNGTPEGQPFPFDPMVGGRVAIYRVWRDGTEPEKLTDFGQFIRAYHARPSPDNERIAFEAVPTGSNQAGIYVMNADGSGAVRIGEGTSPDWTPGGEVVWGEPDFSDGGWNLTAAQPDGSGRRVLLERLYQGLQAAFRQPSLLYYP